MFDNSHKIKKKSDHPKTHPRATHMRVLHHAMHMRKHVMPCGRASAHTTRCRTHRSSLARSTVRQAKATPNVSVASNQQQRACTRALSIAHPSTCMRLYQRHPPSACCAGETAPTWTRELSQCARPAEQSCTEQALTGQFFSSHSKRCCRHSPQGQGQTSLRVIRPSQTIADN